MIRDAIRELFKDRVVGKFFGIELKINWTFYALMLAILISSFFKDGAFIAFKGAAKYFILFGCVTIHEYCHCLAARRYGISTKYIVLMCLGGMAHIEEEPQNPKQELVIAAAGPMSNVIIALIGLFLYTITNISAFEWLAIINIILFIFNLIPAYPLDGGRIFKALTTLIIGEKKSSNITFYLALILFSLFIVGSIPLKSISLGIIGCFGLIFVILQRKNPEQSELRQKKLKYYQQIFDDIEDDLDVYDAAEEILAEEWLTQHTTCRLLCMLSGEGLKTCDKKDCNKKDCEIPEALIKMLYIKAGDFTMKEMQVCLSDIRKN